MTEMIFPAETGRRRVWAFLRAILFAVLFLAADFAVGRYDRPLHKGIKSFEGHVLLEMVFLGLAALALTAVLARFSGRRFLTYGFGGGDRVRNLCIGLVCGGLFLSTQLVLMAALGVFSFGTAAPFDAALLSNALLFAGAFAAVAVTEETLFRGYVLVELSRALSFWPAALLLAVLFGIPHWLKGDGENLFGGMQAAVFGLAMSYAALRTRSLWFCVGYHAAWDYAQSFVFGVADSGTVSHGAWLHPHYQGSDWLSGGTVGPEGSVLVILPTLAIVAVAWMLGRETAPQGNAMEQGAAA